MKLSNVWQLLNLILCLCINEYTYCILKCYKKCSVNCLIVMSVVLPSGKLELFNVTITEIVF